MVTWRFFSFFLAGVIVASTIFPASAWGKDSFISGGEEFESSVDVALSDDLPAPDVYVAPRRAPRMFKASAADQAAVEANTTGKLVVPDTMPSFIDCTTQIRSKYYFKSDAGGIKTEFDYWRDVVFSADPTLSWEYHGTARVFRPWYNTITYTADIGSDEKIRGLAAICSDRYRPPSVSTVGSDVVGSTDTSFPFTVSYDVSSYNFFAFSLDGIEAYLLSATGPYWPNWSGVVWASSVDVLVDGQQVLSLSRGNSTFIDFGGYVYSGSSPVSTISFRWHMPFLYFVSDSTSYNGTYEFVLRSDVESTNAKALTISFLDGQDVINAQNDKTKNDINKHEELESQWVGSMTENFNALGFDSFSWSDSLVSGFSLFSGIFMDIWRALGGATILFTFPLLLGVALLLIGRISRSGGRSGSGKGGGDGG